MEITYSSIQTVGKPSPLSGKASDIVIRHIEQSRRSCSPNKQTVKLHNLTEAIKNGI